MPDIPEERAEKELQTQGARRCQAVCMAGLLYFFLYTHRAAGRPASVTTVCEGPAVATQIRVSAPLPEDTGAQALCSQLGSADNSDSLASQAFLSFPRPAHLQASILCSAPAGKVTAPLSVSSSSCTDVSGPAEAAERWG